MTGNVTSRTIKTIELKNGTAASTCAQYYWIWLIDLFQIFSLSVMMTCMKRSRNDADIRRFIVDFHSIDMMYLFVGFERSSKNLLGNKTMFIDIAILHRAFVFWTEKLNITVRSDDLTSRHESGSSFNIVLAKNFKDVVVRYSKGVANFTRRQPGSIK